MIWGGDINVTIPVFYSQSNFCIYLALQPLMGVVQGCKKSTKLAESTKVSTICLFLEIELANFDF